VSVLDRIGFNPTLVRLRPSYSDSGADSGSWFQSHAGSIEAPGCGLVPRPGLSFQSHAGSIEAQGGDGSGFLHLTRFNPTLVRLRRGEGWVEACQVLRVSIPRWFD